MIVNGLYRRYAENLIKRTSSAYHKYAIILNEASRESRNCR